MPAVVNIAAVANVHEAVTPTPGAFRLSRSDADLSQALTVHYQVAGTASPGVDYQALTGSALIPAGQSAVDIAVLPIDDLTPEFPESVQLTLHDAPDYDLGNAAQATVYIRNSETIPLIAGTNLTFAIGYTVPETTELPVLTAEVLPFGAIFTIVHSEPHPPGAHTFGQFSWTPLLTQIGPHEVVFRVTVPGTSIDEMSSLTILVLPNLPPQISLGGSAGAETDAQTQQFSWSVADDVALAAVGVTVSKNGSALFTSNQPSGGFNFDASGPGNYSITVTALDSTGQSASASQSVTVSDDDTAGPNIVLGGSIGTESVNQPQQFTWNVSDASGLAALTVVITQDTGGGPVEIFRTEDTADATGSFSFDTHGPGTFAIAVTATDADSDWNGDASTSSGTRTVAVQANRPPVLTVPGPFTVAEGQTLTFQVSATDPDGDPLTFSIDLLPEDATFDPATLTYNASTQTWSQTFTWTPCCDQSGPYTLSFQVDDGRGGVAVGEVSINVTDVPAQQHIAALAARVATLTELPPGQRNTLLNRLDNAVASLDRGDTPIAITRLQAFVNQVDNLLNRPNLSTPTREELREIQEKVAELIVCLQAAAGRASLRSIEFVLPQSLPPAAQGPYGELSQDNPAAQGGGWRIFPDAVGRVVNGVVTGNNTPHNLVRIRVVVENADAGTVVTFRSFDVDDPSSDSTIDPNDPLVGGVRTPRGGDNRGVLQQTAQYDRPRDSFQPGANDTNGYAGMLRPVGGAFFPPTPGFIELGGRTVQVRVQRVGGQWIAEVELAVSYAPGDNFRVAASIDEFRAGNGQPRKVGDLSRATDVPVTGAIPNFDGVVTEQLSVWRHVHVEFDRMAATAGDIYAGETVGQPRPVRGRPGFFNVTVALAYNKYQFEPNGIPEDVPTLDHPFQDRQFDGGVLQLGENQFLTILESTVAPNNNQRLTFLVQGQPIVPANGKLQVRVADDDSQIGVVDGVRKIVSRADPFATREEDVFALMQASPDLAVNRYAAAYIEPEYDQLRQFNTARRARGVGALSKPLPARTHLNSTSTPPGRAIDEERYGFDLLHAYHGAAAARTELYWTVYLAMAFQSAGGDDGDPPSDPTAMPPLPGQIFGYGLSKNRSETGKLSYSALYVETARDLVATASQMQNPNGLTAEQVLARGAVHEVGHQFGLVDVNDPGNDGTGHRPGQNLMAPSPTFYADNQFVFASEDLVFLRMRRNSP